MTQLVESRYSRKLLHIDTIETMSKLTSYVTNIEVPYTAFALLMANEALSEPRKF